MKNNNSKLSIDGYKKTSKDRFKNSLIINSDYITTKDMAFPIVANGEVLYPNTGDYKFKGPVFEQPLAKSGIHIKSSHKGLLHKNLGIPEGKKIPSSKLSIKSGDSAAVKKRKQFAINAKKWKHEDGGELAQYGDNLQPINPQDYLKGMQATGWKPNPNMPTLPHQKIPSYQEYRERELDKQYPHRLSTQQQADLFDWEFGYNGPQGSNKGHNWQKYILPGLLALDAIIPGEEIKRPVVQPLETYNEHPYGIGSQAIAQYGGAMYGRIGSEYRKSGKMKDGGDLPYNPFLTEKYDGKKGKVTKAKSGSTIDTVYEHGGTYDLPDDEIKRLLSMGYELKIK